MIDTMFSTDRYAYISIVIHKVVINQFKHIVS